MDERDKKKKKPWPKFRPLFQAMSWVFTGLMQAVGASHKVFEFIDRKPEIQYDKGTVAPDQLEGRIEFKDVSFSYPSRQDTQVLKVCNP